jgi:glycosyltransferase involved in cell wall biosynthesis
MASGLPVVAFANTALPEIIGDGGVLVADGDVGAMADAVAALIDDPAEGTAVIQRGRARARAFDWKETARRYAEIYSDAATDRR